jgi:hypothetical protein
MVAQKGGAPDGREQLLKSFRQLLDARAAEGARIATKEQAAERQRDQQVLEVAATYTVQSIVKGLADLQLDFADSVGGLAEKLLGEASKLDQIGRAIEIEARRLAELRNVRIAADALDLLVHEHDAERRTFEVEARDRRAAFERQRDDQRAAWDRERAEFETAEREYAEALGRERTQAEEDHTYEAERQRTVEADAYAERRRALERDLDETANEKERACVERERLAGERQSALAEYRARAEALPTELEAATRKAREDALAETLEAEQVKAALLEREVAANEQVYELKIQALEATIAQQTAQIESLRGQLQTALEQTQNLAMRAVDGSRAQTPLGQTGA